MVADSVMTQGLGILLAVVAGCSLALMGFTYKIGARRKITPAQIMLIVCVFGTISYGIRCAWIDWSTVPWWFWLVGLGIGVTQCLAIELMGIGLKMGPLSALWCAVGLGFLPVLLYGRIFLGQSLDGWKIAGVIAAVGCVVAASMGQGSGAAGPGLKAGRKAMGFLAMIVVLTLLNAALSVAQFDLGLRASPNGGSYLSQLGDLYYLMIYVTLGGFLLAELSIRRVGIAPKGLLSLGLVAGFGSVVGLQLSGQAASLAKGIAYPICGASGILITAIVATIAFHEKRTKYWYLTVGLGVLAVVLGNL